jgi:hypothetical protein
VIGLGVGVGTAVRVTGWEPRLAVAWRHSFAEAAYRIGGRWADLADWWRSGP